MPARTANVRRFSRAISGARSTSSAMAYRTPARAHFLLHCVAVVSLVAGLASCGTERPLPAASSSSSSGGGGASATGSATGGVGASTTASTTGGVGGGAMMNGLGPAHLDPGGSILLPTAPPSRSNKSERPAGIPSRRDPPAGPVRRLRWRWMLLGETRGHEQPSSRRGTRTSS